jgi:hypothetical protein
MINKKKVVTFRLTYREWLKLKRLSRKYNVTVSAMSRGITLRTLYVWLP